MTEDRISKEHSLGIAPQRYRSDPGGLITLRSRLVPLPARCALFGKGARALLELLRRAHLVIGGARLAPHHLVSLGERQALCRTQNLIVGRVAGAQRATSRSFTKADPSSARLWIDRIGRRPVQDHLEDRSSLLRPEPTHRHGC
jgi:hypothetical protein